MQERIQLGGGVSTPPFSFRYNGPALVCGNAACLHDDLVTARKVYPDAPVIAVNGAAREVKALALYSKHPERFVSLRWIHHQRRRFGDGFTVHGSNIEKNGALPHVDYWWPDARGGGGSAWGARKVAWLMGFDPVILCGCPLVPGPYVGGHSMGGLMMREDVNATFRHEIEMDLHWHQGCLSVSGWSKDFFGEPA